MFVIRNKENKDLRRAVGLSAIPIKKRLPNLEYIQGAQCGGGVVIGKETTPTANNNDDEHATSTASTYVSPKIYVFGDKKNQHSDNNDDDDAHDDETLATSIKDHLMPIADQAHFGKGEETVVDTHVRNTLCIPPSRCRVEWNPHLAHAVAEFGREVLHLSTSQVHHVSAELHNVLIYREGDFFAPHRDSYKKAGHIGTMSVLVSGLDDASASGDVAGGTVCFAVGTELRKWDASEREPWAAWIGSVRHAVTKVTRGTRVVAVFNLIFNVDDENGSSKGAGVRGQFKKPSSSSSLSTSPIDTTYMPGASLGKMPIALFHRLVEAPHLNTAGDAKTLRLVCRSLNDQIGGIVGCLSKQFIAAHREARFQLQHNYPPRGLANKYIPVVLPLRNIYSTGGDVANVPPHHLFGQDLLLYEAAAMALGKSRIKIIAASAMLERDTDSEDDQYLHAPIFMARDFAGCNSHVPQFARRTDNSCVKKHRTEDDADASSAKSVQQREEDATRNTHLAEISTDFVRCSVDFDITARAIPFEPCCMFWGARRYTLSQYRKRGKKDEWERGSSEDSIADPHNYVDSNQELSDDEDLYSNDDDELRSDPSLKDNSLLSLLGDDVNKLCRSYDPLHEIDCFSYTSDLYGNDAHHKLCFYQMGVMFFVLGWDDPDEVKIDWREIIGPSPDECVEDIQGASLARGRVYCPDDF